jgi:hypothetical protein
VLELEGDTWHTGRPSRLLEPRRSSNGTTPSYYIIELELCTGFSAVDVCVLQLGYGAYIYVSRVGFTFIKEVVSWRWTAGRPPHGQPTMQCGDTASLVLDSPLLPPGEHTHQVWTETRLSHGRGRT